MMREVAGARVADMVLISGDVTLGTETSVWPFCSIRGDVAPVLIGRRCSIQDGSVLHCAYGVPLVIEDEVVIGHAAVVHCSRVGRRSLIGIGARVLDNAVIGEECIVAAGAVVPPGMEVPDGSLVMGVPAALKRELRTGERHYIERVVNHYVKLSADYVAGRVSAWPPAKVPAPKDSA